MSQVHDLEALSGLLDEQLSSARRAEMEVHLKGCSSCRTELAKLREVSSLVRSLPERPLPAGFIQKLQRRRLEAPTPASQPRYLLPAPARYMAFAMSSVIVTVFLYEQAKVSFPMIGSSAAVSMTESARPSAALSSDDTAEGRSAVAKKLARASGDPLFAGAAAPGTMASQLQDKKGPTNLDMLAALEQEKSRTGIKGFYREPKEFKSIKELHAGVNAHLLKANPVPAETGSGSVARLLSQPEAGPAKANRREQGAPLASQPRFHPAKTAAAPAAPATAEADEVRSPDASGLLLRSAAEREKAWAERGIRSTPPSVDFSANMIALVIAPDLQSAVEVAGVETRANAVVLRYRLLPRPAAVSLGRKDAAAPAPSYQYRVIPRTEKPVHFERAD